MVLTPGGPGRRHPPAPGLAVRRIARERLLVSGVVVISQTIVRLGVHSIFGRRRGVLLFVLPVILVGLSVLVRALVGQDDDATEATLFSLGLVVVVPLVALLATSGLLAPEIDDGSISYLLAKPISRHTIVASKLAVALRLRGRLRRGPDAGRRPGPAHRPARGRHRLRGRGRSSAARRTAPSSRCCRS